jgi:hypothetical protein
MEGAQGMVEFALVLPLLLLVIFGIIELGRLLVIYSSVGTASREGARYASAAGEPTPGVPYYLDCAGIRAAAQRMGVLIGMQASDILISYDQGPDPASGGPPVVISTTCPDPSDYANNNDYMLAIFNLQNQIRLGSRVVVDVSAQYTPLLPLVNIPPLPMNSTTARTILKQVGIAGTPGPGFNPAPPNPTLTAASINATATSTRLTATAHSATQTWVATTTGRAQTQTATAEIVTQTAIASETQWSQTQTAAVPPTAGPSPTATNTPTLTRTPTLTPTPSLTFTMTPSPTRTPEPCPDWTYQHDGSQILWTIINSDAAHTYTLQLLRIPWSNNSVTFVGVEFGSAILWSGNDTDNNGGSSFSPTSATEYTWTPTSPDFTLPAGVGTSKVLTMSWSGIVGSIESPDTIAIFENDQLGSICTLQQAFIYTP